MCVKTLSCTLRDKHRVRVYANWVPRNIFGLNRKELAGDWRKLHNEELSDSYGSSNVVWVIDSMRVR
jgi:hypothetical protein